MKIFVSNDLPFPRIQDDVTAHIPAYFDFNRNPLWPPCAFDWHCTSFLLLKASPRLPPILRSCILLWTVSVLAARVSVCLSLSLLAVSFLGRSERMQRPKWTTRFCWSCRTCAVVSSWAWVFFSLIFLPFVILLAAHAVNESSGIIEICKNILMIDTFGLVWFRLVKDLFVQLDWEWDWAETIDLPNFVPSYIGLIGLRTFSLDHTHRHRSGLMALFFTGSASRVRISELTNEFFFFD